MEDSEKPRIAKKIVSETSETSIEQEYFTYWKYIFPVISIVSTSGLVYVLFFRKSSTTISSPKNTISSPEKKKFVKQTKFEEF